MRSALVQFGVAWCVACAAEAGELATALQPYVERQTLAGAVLVVANADRVLEVDTVGYSDVEAKTPMQADRVMWIASMSKPITAAAVMMLVDEGRVSLDDPVTKYLPEFKDQWLAVEQDADHLLLKKPSQPITVRHLLSHTSGMPFKSALEQPTLDGLPLRDAVRSYAMTPLQTEPGTKYQYSNAGINTAGRIIEIVTGQSYEDFLQQRLFDPLGLKDTTFWPNEAQLARLAKAYKSNADKSGLAETTVGQLLYPLNDRQHRFPMPAGGLFSTAADVTTFCQMLLAGGEWQGKRYLSAKAIQALSTRQTPMTVKESYGLGFTVNGPEYGHGGAFATNMSIDSQRKLVFVYMVQHAGYPRDESKELLPTFKKTALARFPTP